jgi:hypothetical protein
MNPASFSTPWAAGLRHRNVYEMRTYTYASGDMPRCWMGGAALRRGRNSRPGSLLDERLGGLNKFVHLGVLGSHRAHPRP